MHSKTFKIFRSIYIYVVYFSSWSYYLYKVSLHRQFCRKKSKGCSYNALKRFWMKRLQTHGSKLVSPATKLLNQLKLGFPYAERTWSGYALIIKSSKNYKRNITSQSNFENFVCIPETRGKQWQLYSWIWFWQQESLDLKINYKVILSFFFYQILCRKLPQIFNVGKNCKFWKRVSVTVLASPILSRDKNCSFGLYVWISTFACCRLWGGRKGVPFVQSYQLLNQRAHFPLTLPV